MAENMAAAPAAGEEMDLAALMDGRARTYGLMARLFLKEVDKAALTELQGMRFPAATSSAKVDEGYHMLYDYLRTSWDDSITELAIDYVRTFIGHGVNGFSAAYPFESVYTSERRLMMQEARAEVLQTLIDADVVVHEVDEDGEDVYSVTMDLPEDFALDQPLSPFLLAALELLDPESPEYAFDLVSMVEATLEDPRQVLRAQERKARDAAMAEMKMDGVDYDERLERIADVTYPKPLEDLLDAAFSKYCDAVPWARDYCLRPKSVLRDMLESAADFKGYIQKLGIMRYEGILLRYLSEAFRGLDRTIPEDKRTEQLKDIIAWLGLIVRSVDSSLVDEWENAGAVLDAAPPDAAGVEAVVRDRRGLTVLVRNALFSRVRMAAHRDAAGLGEADGDWGFGERAWMQALDEYYEAHEEILLDADARSKAYLMFDEADEEELHVWHVRQIFHDEAGDNDFVIAADVDLDATQEGDGVVFANYRVGFADELLDEF